MERIAGYMVDLVRGAALLVVRVVVSVRHNVSLGLLSIALAVSLWLFVTDADNPEHTDFFSGFVPVEAVNVPPDLAVFSMSQPSVSVRVSAPEDVFDHLSTEDFRATVDLSGVTSKEVTLRVRVASFHSEVEVVEASPSRVTVTLENVTSRMVSVKVQPVGTSPLGFEVASTSVTPGEVTVSGPESLVNRVDAAVADVNLTGVRVDISRRVELRGRDASGGDIVGVTIDPRSVQVELKLVQREFSRGFVVSPTVRGVPAEGYQVVSVQVEPALVVVSGTVEVLQSIDAVEGVRTEEVNIAEARSDVVRTVRLSLPEGARVSDPGDVTVRVHIEPARGQFSFSVVPRLSGLASDLEATPAQSEVRVTLEGPVPVLTALTAADIGVTLDVSGLSAGAYTVGVGVEVPAGTTVISTDPPALGVTLSPR
ncbi:MAG: CdaR family protein [Dehalococcoidia bacterium]